MIKKTEMVWEYNGVNENQVELRVYAWMSKLSADRLSGTYMDDVMHSLSVQKPQLDRVVPDVADLLAEALAQDELPVALNRRHLWRALLWRASVRQGFLLPSTKLMKKLTKLTLLMSRQRQKRKYVTIISSSSMSKTQIQKLKRYIYI